MLCIYCGANNAAEAIFCQKCGKRLETENKDDSTLLAAPPIPSSPYESPPYTNYGSSEPIYPPPPPLATPESISNPYEKPSLHRTQNNRMYLFVIAILVIMLIFAGVLVSMLVEKGDTQGTGRNTSNTPNQLGTAPSNSSPTVSAISSTPTPSPTLTATPSPTPSPTPTSPQPGTVLYQANWSDGLSGWMGSSDWKVSNGMLVSDGSYNEPNNYASPTIEPPYQVKGTSDYAVEVRIQEVGAPGCFDAVTLRGSAASDGIQGYRLAIECFGGATIYAAHGSSLNQIAHVDFDPGNTWHTYRLEAKGTLISAFIDGIQVLSVNDATYLSGGIIGIKSQATQIYVSSFKVIVL